MLEIHHSGREENKKRVPDQKGVSLPYVMLGIHHSGWELFSYFILFSQGRRHNINTSSVSQVSRGEQTLKL